MVTAQTDHAGSLALRCVAAVCFGAGIAGSGYAGLHSCLRIAERQFGEAGSGTALARCNADSGLGKQPALLLMLKGACYPALTCKQAKPAGSNAQEFGGFFGREIIGSCSES